MRRRKPLSMFQIGILFILWIILVIMVLTSTPRIDGPVILSLFISGALVLIPLYKQFNKH